MLAQMPLSPPSLEETFPDDKSVLASQTRAFRTPPPNEEAPGMHRLQYLTPFSEDGSQTLVTDELVSRLAGSPSEYPLPGSCKKEYYSSETYDIGLEAQASPSQYDFTQREPLAMPDRATKRGSCRPRRTAVKRSQPGSVRAKSGIDDNKPAPKRRRHRSPTKPLSEYAEEHQSIRIVKAFSKAPPNKQAKVNAVGEDVSIEVLDTLALASRSTADRQSEAQRSGKIKRPYNAFILYRMTYQLLAQRIGETKSHQSVSTLCGDSWASESMDIKLRFQELAQLERQGHMHAFPDYKFQPKKEVSRSRSATREAATPGPKVHHRYDGVVEEDVLFNDSMGLHPNYPGHYQIPAPPSMLPALMSYPEFGDAPLNMFPQYGSPSASGSAQIHIDYAENGPSDHMQYVDPQLFHGSTFPYFGTSHHLSPAVPIRSTSPFFSAGHDAEMALPSAIMDFPIDDPYLQGKSSEWEFEPIGMEESSFFDDALGSMN